MKRFYFLIVILLTTGETYAQNTLQGYLNPGESLAENTEITLIRLVPGENFNIGELVAKGRLQKDGYFVFPDSVFTEKDEIYKIQVEIVTTGENLPDTSIYDLRTLILSNRDSVRFRGGNYLATGYSNTNEADREWQKLKKYEERNLNEDSDPGVYLSETRKYTKDSLEILLVKLLSIQTLDEKQLLEKDIKENPDFYLDLLEKLHESDLDPGTYTYLENKIRATHQELLNRKYQISLALNFFGFSGLIGLLVVLFRMNKKSGNIPTADLSRQEEKIKNLILSGKTNKEIAADLFISISTVKTHTSNIYSKLNVSNRKDLVLKHQNHTGTNT